MPFRAAIAAGVAGIMTAHLLVPALDEERPGTLSPAIVTGLLKEKLGFEGVVFTDDIGMKAISALYGTPEATLAAIAAGCDVVLMCGDSQEPQFAAMEMLVHALEDGTLPLTRVEDALEAASPDEGTIPRAPASASARRQGPANAARPRRASGRCRGNGPLCFVDRRPCGRAIGSPSSRPPVLSPATSSTPAWRSFVSSDSIPCTPTRSSRATTISRVRRTCARAI